MLKIIMDSGIAYLVNWTVKELLDEMYDDGLMVNVFIDIGNGEYIMPAHISSIEAYHG